MPVILTISESSTSKLAVKTMFLRVLSFISFLNTENQTKKLKVFFF